MSAQDLLTALRRRPFLPFRLYISDGATYDIRHPELVMVAVSSAVVGLPGVGQHPLPVERYDIVDLRHIVRLAPLDAQAAPGHAGDGV
jgi:hypothetical protein